MRNRRYEFFWVKVLLLSLNVLCMETNSSRLISPYKPGIRVLRKNKEGENNSNFGMVCKMSEHFGLQPSFQSVSIKTTYGSTSIQKRTLTLVTWKVF